MLINVCRTKQGDDLTNVYLTKRELFRVEKAALSVWDSATRQFTTFDAEGMTFILQIVKGDLDGDNRVVLVHESLQPVLAVPEIAGLPGFPADENFWTLSWSVETHNIEQAGGPLEPGEKYTWGFWADNADPLVSTPFAGGDLIVLPDYGGGKDAPI